MRRTVLLLACAALALLLASGVAQAEEKLDQENAEPWDSPSHYEEFDSDNMHLAQSFTARSSGRVSKISVRISKSVCGPGSSGDTLYKDIQVRIIGSGGSSATLPASQVPYRACTSTSSWWTLPWTDVTFGPDNRPYVIAGQEYRLALEPESVSYDTPSYQWYRNSDYYRDGGGYYRYLTGPYWWKYGALDFLFKTYVDPSDTDGDGLINDVDQCDFEPGPASNNGCPPDITSPTGGVDVNGGARITKGRSVTLAFDATDPSPYPSGVNSMRLKNAGGSWTAWQPYTTSKSWKLTRDAGKKTVYVQYVDAAGNVSASASDSITYRP